MYTRTHHDVEGWFVVFFFVQKKNHIFKHRHSVKPGVMQQAKPVPFRKCNRIIPDSKQSMSRKGIVGKIFPKQYGHGRDITNP